MKSDLEKEGLSNLRMKNIDARVEIGLQKY